MKYIKRSIEPVILDGFKQFPAVILTGPRQSGKTTLLQHLFGQDCNYVSLQLPDVKEAAILDPRGFLAANPPPVIYDEVQSAPELLIYIKDWVDRNRNAKGQFILSGSQNILLMEQVSETLAGRAAVLHLLPLSFREIANTPVRPLPWEPGWVPEETGFLSHHALWETLLRGSFPELWAEPNRDAALWYSSYLETYLERDVRSLRQVGDLTQFRLFMRALAARNAQLLDLTDLSKDLGIAVNTAKAWLSVLETTHQVVLLRPFFANIGKRLVKRPKVHFVDTGLLCHLAGLRDPLHAAAGPMGGAIMESAVLSELLRVYASRGSAHRIHFWRTSTGVEVDLVIEQEGHLIPIEVKTTATPRPAMSSTIRRLQADLPEKVRPGYVIHAGDITLPLGNNNTALPLASM